MKFVAALLLVVALAGCRRSAQTTEAVRQGVIESIAGRVDVKSMDVNVASVNFKGDTADAIVEFRAKGSGPGTGIQMRYTLESKGGRWVVTNRAESGASPHSATMGGQGGAPQGGAMPPGHPPVGGGAAAGSKK